MTEYTRFKLFAVVPIVTALLSGLCEVSDLEAQSPRSSRSVNRNISQCPMEKQVPQDAKKIRTIRVTGAATETIVGGQRVYVELESNTVFATPVHLTVAYKGGERDCVSGVHVLRNRRVLFGSRGRFQEPPISYTIDVRSQADAVDTFATVYSIPWIVAFSHPTGSFKRKPGSNRWVEYSTKVDYTFSFIERNRDETWIYLHDGSRNADLKLPISGGWAQFRTSGKPYFNLHRVEPVFSH